VPLEGLFSLIIWGLDFSKQVNQGSSLYFPNVKMVGSLGGNMVLDLPGGSREDLKQFCTVGEY